GFLRRSEGGEPGTNLGRIQDFVRDGVELGASPRAGHQLATRRAYHECAGTVEQDGVGLGLELGPQFVRPPHDGYVERMLVYGLTSDAGSSVRGAECVRWGVPIEANHAHSAPGQMVERSAAHRPEADHNHVGAEHFAHDEWSWMIRHPSGVRAQTRLNQPDWSSWPPPESRKLPVTSA